MVMIYEDFGAGREIFTCPEKHRCQNRHSGIIFCLFSSLQGWVHNSSKKAASWDLQNCDTWFLKTHKISTYLFQDSSNRSQMEKHWDL